MRKTISNLKAGEVVLAGYKRNSFDSTDANRFVGFHANGAYFTKLQDVKEFYGARNLSDLEAKFNELHGPNNFRSVYAHFKNIEENYTWEAYLWQGCFRVGTSADRLSLANCEGTK
jgi:hypothetical protein